MVIVAYGKIQQLEQQYGKYLFGEISDGFRDTSQRMHTKARLHSRKLRDKGLYRFRVQPCAGLAPKRLLGEIDSL